MVRFSPLINIGVDAYNAFEQHNKVYESAMEDLSAGESFTLTNSTLWPTTYNNKSMTFAMTTGIHLKR
jgi:hypothetical protein